MYPNLLSPQVISSVILGVCFVWLLVLSFFFYKYIRHYNRLVKGKGVGGLSQALDRHFEGMAAAQSDIKGVKAAITQIEKDSRGHLQRFGVVRFNPFPSTGSDQSFAVSLLDAEGNGVVISSLHAREVTRVYSKPVKGGKEAGFEFSKEEQGAIKEAWKGAQLPKGG
ncbi:DUF4446 family protein [Candidatus Parcubacteria bacterium]|nr:DUF4446 family protein [Candidatus Parcubacteria bacterium]